MIVCYLGRLYSLIKKIKKKVLIVGAGLAGSTIARILAEENIEVKILEKRTHIAGNIFDYINRHDERIHKYGPHLLHCNKNDKALSFLSKFTEWIFYEHRVRAILPDGATTPLPVNKKTIEHFLGRILKTSKKLKIF